MYPMSKVIPNFKRFESACQHSHRWVKSRSNDVTQSTCLGRRAFRCHICNQTFSANHTLKRHMTKHSEERPYMCPYCRRTYKTNGSCQKHISARHKNEQIPVVGNTVEVGGVEEDDLTNVILFQSLIFFWPFLFRCKSSKHLMTTSMMVMRLMRLQVIRINSCNNLRTSKPAKVIL